MLCILNLLTIHDACRLKDAEDKGIRIELPPNPFVIKVSINSDLGPYCRICMQSQGATLHGCLLLFTPKAFHRQSQYEPWVSCTPGHSFLA